MESDESLIAELGAALDEAEDAADVAGVGRALWAWHDPDARLAELVADSATEPLAGVRSGGDARLLRFTADQVGIDLELLDGHLRGLALAPDARRIELHGTDGTLLADAEVDATGWFDLTLPAGGTGRAMLVRLRLADSAGTETWTAWFRL